MPLTKRIAISLACAIALTATACSHRRLAEAPLPDGTQAIAPGPDVPVSLAAFSGAWHGYWGGELDSLLVVERISPTGEATGVYAWGADPGGEFRNGNMTFQGTIANGKLSFGNRVRFDFAMQGDGTLLCERTIDGKPDDHAVMVKVP
ncbi:MAG: hypothetical protein U1F33_04235 [Alphaproteobacteria bacterium]